MNNIINIYQVFTRLFRNDNTTNKKFGTKEENGCCVFSDFSDKALQEIKALGTTHIWYTGILRHTTTTDYSKYSIPTLNPRVIKGRAGSPYAIIDYYDINPDLATDVNNRQKEFDELVERTHKNGLKCIIDFVPNHVGREYKSLSKPSTIKDLGEDDDKTKDFDINNNFYYINNQNFVVPQGIDFPYIEGASEYIEYPAKVTGNDSFSNAPSINDWYETIKLNYGIDYKNSWSQHFEPIPDTWHKMYDILKFWTNKGVDGFRCDMAEMVPVQFWAWVIPQIKQINSEIIFIAEVYNPQEYKNFINKACFDYLYDKVGLYDILRLIIEGHGSAKYISNYWKSIDVYQKNMLRFLENHDEHRIASKQFASDPWIAIPSIIVSATMYTGPFMIYFGQEIGETADEIEGFSGIGRTTIFDYWHVTEYQKWVNKGEFNESLLSENQKSLRRFYKNLLNIRISSDAIANGSFYDIMYANHNNLDIDKIYAYIRHSENQTLLIIINFDNHNSKEFNLIIPQHAIEVCKLEEKNYQAVDLLYGSYINVISMLEAKSNGIKFNLEKKSGLILDLK